MTDTLRSSDGRVIVPARMRRRRVEVRRGQGRRRLRRVVAVGALALILLLGFALLRSPLLAVDTVVVNGSHHVSRAEVERATGIHPGVAMMDVSSHRAEKRLESLPWVASADVKRRWPGQVEVRVVDRSPVAQVAGGKSFASVDAHGRVLQTEMARDPSLVLLGGVTVGAAGSRVAHAAPLLRTAVAVPKSQRNQVSGISFAKDDSVTLTLRSGGTVRLGGADGLPAKFASLDAVFDQVGSLGPRCTLDVAVPSAPAVTPEYGCG